MKHTPAGSAGGLMWMGIAILLSLAAAGCSDAKEDETDSRARRPKMPEQSPPDYSNYTEGKPMSSRERANAVPRQRPAKGSLAAAQVGPRKNRDEVAARRLRAVGMGIKVYVARNHKYPMTVNDLIDQGLTVRKYLQSARDPKRTAIYRRPAEKAPPNTLMLYDPVPNDQGKVMVLLVSRQTALVDRAQLDRMLGKDK